MLALIAVWEIWRTERAGAGVPDDDSWKQAADVVRIQHKPGELIVFAPDWIDPVGRYWLGDLIPIDMAARMDGARYGVVWELAIRGAHAPEATGSIDAEIEVDGITVRKYVRKAPVIATDFVASFTTGAAKSGGDFARPPSVELAEVGFAPHRCVQLVPVPNKSATITYQAQLGTELVGYVGLADVFTRRDVREPGRLAVAIDGKEVANVTIGDDDGWVRFAAKTTPGATTVTFTATAVGPGARDRLICFAAEARQ
ncbi:MAG TPA: hypothetical protein VL463_24435 [Kofleriaceae bacterium]|nr:hypothetical protein [Kofleriaceae bacterium]